MIKYKKTIEFNGDTSAVMAAAKNFFISNGFKLELRGDDTLLLKGPGMISNRENPIRGVFATRSQLRPNKLGVSDVELISVRGNIVKVRGLDALDGTPIIDIKPMK